MSLKMLGIAAAALLVSAGPSMTARAADSLEQALPLDSLNLGEVQTGVGLSGAAAQLPDSDSMFTGANQRMEDANSRVADGVAAAAQAVVLQGGNKDAEAMLYALPYVYSAVPATVGAIEQGAGATVGALGGALNLGALQGAGAGL